MKQACGDEFSRRGFFKTAGLAAGSLVLGCSTVKLQQETKPGGVATLSAAALPKGESPAPLKLPHFPDGLHAFVWRNWPLVPVSRIAAVVGASEADIVRIGQLMGLPPAPRITRDQQRRSYLTVIRRNWHLLPYEQLLALLEWTPEQLAYTLREDDFLYTKLGNLKPHCEPLQYEPPDEKSLARARQIARIMQEEFPGGLKQAAEPLFNFVAELSAKPSTTPSRLTHQASHARLSPRFCYSYFALYGDPLLETETDPYPDGYLARLAESGVDGVWLQAVLYKLTPFPWDTHYSAHYEERLKNLRALVGRARQHGIAVYLYLNEPRAMPLSFFETRPQMKGVVEGDHAALCTSNPEVQKYLTQAVGAICRAVPELGGFFTITASENLTNCWSHNAGANCARCSRRSPGEVIAEVNRLIFEGTREPGGIATARPRLLVWDWGWPDNAAEEIINRLPIETALMSVSEWSLPIQRGGVHSAVGEYSISAVGPGPRAQRRWEWARKRGLKTIAKIQAGNTWELSAVPYIPALANVAEHAAHLRQAKVDGVMLGWTLGGYPSPNLEVIATLEQTENVANTQLSSPSQVGGSDSTDRALEIVASRRFGKLLAPAIVQAWREFSAAFSEFPFHIGLVYSAPLQVGPANLLWEEATGYHASMVGFPYDDLDGWRSIYPPEIFISQFEKVANGFELAIDKLTVLLDDRGLKLQANERRALSGEINVATAAALHFRSVANQARFVLLRRELSRAKDTTQAARPIAAIHEVIKGELALARRLYDVQSRDSRIGFEASNQYYYVPVDLAEKVLNCRDLLDRWLAAERSP